jgi:hypothetical protein
MHSTNLFEIISTFSKEEFKEFGDLVKSPFFNTNKSLIALYEHIRKYFPDLSNKSLIKEKTFKKLFPGEKYNDNRMRLLIHRMNLLAEEYLLQIKGRELDYWQKIFLLGELKSRRLYSTYNKNLKEAKRLNQEKNKNTNEYYFVQFTLENQDLGAQVSKNLDANEKAILKEKLNLANSSMYCFSILNILKYSLFIENIKYRMKVDLHESMLEEVLHYIKHHDYSAHPIIMIYYYLNLLVREPDAEENYIYAKTIFFENENEIHTFDSMNIYINLENYLSKLSRRDHTRLKNELFDLYMSRLDKGNYKLGGYMPNQLFKRIVRVSILKGDREFAEKFILKYKKDLKPDLKDSALSYSNALVSFHNKEFRKVLELLSVAYTEDLSHKIDVKNLTLLTLFELEDFHSLKLSLDSYRHFLKNNKILSDPVIKRSESVIRAMKILYNLNIKKDMDINKAKTEIYKSDDLEHREWFIKTIDEI